MKVLVYLALCCRLALASERPLVDPSTLKLIFGTPKSKQSEDIEQRLQVTDSTCRTDTGDAGRCVAVAMCSNSSLDPYGRHKIDPRSGFGDDSPSDCSYLRTCCSDADVINGTTTKEGPDHGIPAKSGCGWANPDGVGFSYSNAVRGESQFAEYPWVVAIIRETSTQRVHRYEGSGSLIHPSAVLTAAHKVAPIWRKRKLLVRVGEWDSETTDEIYPYQDIEVVDVKIHEEYNEEVVIYDVAVLFLERPAAPAPNVGFACLPAPSLTPARHAQCHGTGWGKDRYGKNGRYQHILKKVSVQYVNHDECQRLLRANTDLGPHFLLHETFMCAGGGTEDTCFGDGGAPLVCPIQQQKDRFVQHGIVAWGKDCGRHGVPGVYVDVAYLRPWIDQVVTGSGLDTTYYTYNKEPTVGGLDAEFVA